MITELIATIIDAVQHGDWRGHLRAWWQVTSRKVATG